MFVSKLDQCCCKASEFHTRRISPIACSINKQFMLCNKTHSKRDQSKVSILLPGSYDYICESTIDRLHNNDSLAPSS